MNIYNELPTAFPWYEGTIKKQNRFRFNVKSDDWAGLISPINSVLPFEFSYPYTFSDEFGTVLLDADINEWKIYDLNDHLVATLSAAAIAQINKAVRENKQYFYFAGGALTVSGGAALNLAKGFYYSRIKLVEHGGTAFFTYFYSEVFYVPDCLFSTTTAADQIPFLKLEWWNASDLRPIFYNDLISGVPKFRNVIYLDTFVHQSEPEIQEDGEKDGNDETIPTFQKCLLKYRITELVPDFLKLALVVMQMHDHVKLTTEYGLRSGEMHRLTTNTTTEEGGAFSTVDIIFEEDVAMIKKACADNMTS